MILLLVALLILIFAVYGGLALSPLLWLLLLVVIVLVAFALFSGRGV